MLDYVGTDRPIFDQKVTAYLAALGCAMLSEEAATNVVDECALDAILDLVSGRKHLARVTLQADKETIIGYLLEKYQLAALPVRPYQQIPLVLTTGGMGVVLPGDIPGLEQYVVNLIHNTQSPQAVLGHDIHVSLLGAPVGGIADGEIIVAGTPYDTILDRVFVQAKLPTYAIPTLGLIANGGGAGEVGTTVNLSLLATFTKNDAGNLLALAIKRGSTTVLADTVSPLPATDTIVRVLGAISYQATASYGAGVAKLVSPANTIDTRSPAVRNPNAPQAADAAFVSNVITVPGYYLQFFGPASAAPTNSAQVRALAGQQLTNAGTSFVLNSGTAQRFQVVALAPGKTLVQVVDLDNLNQVITADYQLTTVSVADPSGTVYSYPVYVREQAVPYLSNHRHQITAS